MTQGIRSCRFRAAIAIAVVALSMTSIPAFSQVPSRSGTVPVNFKVDPSTREAQIVTSLYGDFLEKNPDIKVGTVLANLDHGQVFFVIARFEGKASCTEGACHTVVLQYGGPTGWAPIFAHKTKSLALASSSTSSAPNAMEDLIVNGTEKWVWDDNKSYGVTLDGLGTFLQGSFAPPKAVAEAATQALEKDYRGFTSVMAQVGPSGLMGTEFDIGLRDGKAWLLVASQATRFCPPSRGCPAVIMIPRGKGTWSSAGVFLSAGSDVLSPSSTGGVKDIVMGDRSGYRILRWTGTQYRLAATSYPSAVTPAP